MLRQCILSRTCLWISMCPNPIIASAPILCQFQSSRRTLHTSGPPNCATPLPITAHGPPPKPPLPAAGEIREVRKKQRERAAATAAELAGQAAESAALAAEGNTAATPPRPPPPGASDSESSGKPKIGLHMKEFPAATRSKLSAHPSSGRRFWKESWVKEMSDGSFIPHLDSRPLKTPRKQLLALPKRKEHLAQLIAHEWNLLTSAAQATRAYLLPITSLASRVIDLPHTGNYEKARKDMVDMCMKYLDTDTLLCLYPPPNMYMVSEHVGEDGDDGENTLRGRQLKVLADTLTWIEENVFPGISIHPLDTVGRFIVAPSQPQATKERIRRWIEERDDWELVGLERCVVSAKSLLVGIRLVAGWGGDHEKPTSITTPKEEREEGIDRETGGIPQTKDSVLHNRGTNTALSHESSPNSRPPVGRTIDSSNAEAGLDIDPLTGGVASGDPAENKGTNTRLASVAEDKKRVRVARKEETWGIEEAAQAATLEVSWQTMQWGEVEDTHDVEKEDIRRGLGAGWCLVINT
ncbi:hypothetical protein EV426DRAFT_594362 [Tirmania nivea]|nr:hypothetical protein EV426DRAFT_594362 [Tirmania nivea]